MNIKPFVFEGSQKRGLLIGIAIGVVSLLVQFFTGDQYHTEFWSSLLLNTVYFTAIAFTAVFFLSANITGYAGWITTFRRIWEHMGMFLAWMLVPLGILAIAVWAKLNHLYHWNAEGVTDINSPSYDRIIAGKAAFVNPVWYTIAGIGFVAIWFFVAKKLRDASLASDNASGVDVAGYKKTRKWAALYLPLAGFLSPAFFWLLTMSIDVHWYSTMFAWYSMVSGWLGCLAFTIMVIIYLKSRGYLELVNREHLHDLGKFLFGISVFWTYLWFDQFMLIWYANNGEETIYFKERMDHYPVLYWGNLLLNFITPFFVLMRNDTKRKFGTLFFVAAIVFFGHWWDFFYMVKPGARTSAVHAAQHDGHGTAHDEAAIHVDEAMHAATPAEAHAEEEEAVQMHTDSATSTEVVHAEADHAEDVHGEGHNVEAEHTDASHVEDETQEMATATVANTSDVHGEEEHGDEGHSDHHAEFKLGYTLPGFTDFGILIGYLSLLLYFLFGRLAASPLVNKNDPFYEEALHHETGALIDSEQEEGAHIGHH